MKTYQVLATICTVMSVASAADLGSRAAAASSSLKTTEVVSSEIALTTKTQSRRLDEDGPWDNGTKVYKEFANEGWWSGTITSYSQTTGMYTVTWEDGSTDYYDDSNEIDQMVAWASADPQNNPAGSSTVSGAYPAGTEVSAFEDGEWYDGVIIKYGSGTYTIRWDEDDEIEEISEGSIIDQMVEDAYGDDDALPDGYVEPKDASVAVGADVSYYDDEDEEWYDGQITAYKNGVYTVTWEDGSTDEYADSGDDFDDLMQAALDALGDDDDDDGYDSIPVGAEVSYYDDEDDEWYDGKVTAYTNGVYTVTWEDGSTDEYNDFGDEFDDLMQAASDFLDDDDAIDSKPVSGPKFPTGTKLSDWEDDEWVNGEVVDFQNGNYVVQWEDEDELEYYESHNAEDMQELKKMQKDAKGDDDAPPDYFFEDEDLWKIGTPVAIKEDDVLWYGKIDGFSDGAYSIAWDNGEQERLDNYDLVNTMVANYIENPKGMSGVGKFFLSLFIISVCAVGSVYGYKYYQNRQSNRNFVREMDEEGGFQDRPDNLPKII